MTKKKTKYYENVCSKISCLLEEELNETDEIYYYIDKVEDILKFIDDLRVCSLNGEDWHYRKTTFELPIRLAFDEKVDFEHKEFWVDPLTYDYDDEDEDEEYEVDYLLNGNYIPHHVLDDSIQYLKNVKQFTIANTDIGDYTGFLGYLILQELPGLRYLLDISLIFDDEIDMFEGWRIERNSYNRFQIMDLDPDD